MILTRPRRSVRLSGLECFTTFDGHTPGGKFSLRSAEEAFKCRRAFLWMWQRMSDWIKLHRKLDRSPLMENAELLRLWIHLLLNAAYEPKTLLNGVKLQPGQLLVSHQRLADKLRLNKGVTHRMLKVLRNCNAIETQAQRSYTIVTICNWDTYQSSSTDKRNAGATESATQAQRRRNQYKKERSTRSTRTQE